MIKSSRPLRRCFKKPEGEYISSPATNFLSRRPIQGVVLRVRPPGKAGGLRKPWKGILPANLSGGTVFSASCITCHAPRKQGSSRCVLHLFGVEYHPAALKAGSESPFTLSGTARGCHFAKAGQNSAAGLGTPGPAARFCFLFSARTARRCLNKPRPAPAWPRPP